jgi:uncharacterized sporulation protein YeaH/YhbH (DUF444 family)
MTQFIDRRAASKNKSTVNRQRFLHRFKSQLKKVVADSINKRSITDIERGEKVTIPAKDTDEPRLRYGKGGHWEIVHAGNKTFVAGDHIKRADSAGVGQGSQASNTGTGWDEFDFELSREEFLELFFDDLALPNLIKTQIATLPTFKSTRAGFSIHGTPANLSIIRSLRQAQARRIAFSGSAKEKLKRAEEKLAQLLLSYKEEHPEVVTLKAEITMLKNHLRKIPFIDPADLRFRYHIKQALPTTQAVMFCLMDVSGSMDEAKKDIAKRFFILLYLFLTRNYEKIELVFIRHHTVAKAVDEQEFFFSRETGGTVVSSALELMRDIVQARYPASDWNVYAAQASDGDNWSADSPYCQELLLKHLVPLAQYFAYVEIMPRYHQSLWEAYVPVKEQFSNFAMQTINEMSDIYPVFRELFKRKPV